MEKKGDILNQLALISDLLEKINLDAKSSTVIIEISMLEFEKVIEIVSRRYGRKIDSEDNTFTITIGNIDFVFNTSNA